MRSRWCARLLGREQVRRDRMDPRQHAVGEPRAGVARVHERLGGAVVVQQQVAGQHAVDHEVGLDGFVGGIGPLASTRDQVGRGLAGLEAVGQRPQRGHEQDGGPRGDQVGREVGVGRLQRVVPVTVAVGREGGAGHPHLGDAVQRLPQVVLDRGGCGEPVVADERHAFAQERHVASGAQVVASREHRPVEDVTVRVLLALLGQRREEVEGLRPVTTRVLRPEDTQEDVALLVVAAQGGEQAHRSLADVTGAPATARELLQTTGGEVVDEGVLGEPREHRVDPGYLGRQLGVGRAGPPASIRSPRDTVEDQLILEVLVGGGPDLEVRTGVGDCEGDREAAPGSDLQGHPGGATAGAIGEETASSPTVTPAPCQSRRRTTWSSPTSSPPSRSVTRWRTGSSPSSPDSGDCRATSSRRGAPDSQRTDSPSSWEPVGAVELTSRATSPGQYHQVAESVAGTRRSGSPGAPSRRARRVLDEDPQTVGPLHPEVAAAGRQQAVPADVAAGQLGVEGAGHPDVEVRPRVSGTRASPVRSRWPCGRRTVRSLAAVTTWEPSLPNHGEQLTVGPVSTWGRSECPVSSRQGVGVQVVGSEDRCDAEQRTGRGVRVRAGGREASATSAANGRGVRLGLGEGVVGPAAIRVAGRVRMVGAGDAEKTGVVAPAGAMVTGASWRTTRACSCWKRWDGSSAGDRATGTPGRSRATDQLEGVGGPARPGGQRPSSSHGTELAGHVLPDGDGGAVAVATGVRSRYWLT